MNDARRKTLRCIEKELKEICTKLENIKDEEQYAYDNLPESLQMSDYAETMMENVETLEEMIDQLEGYIDEYSAEINSI